MNSPKHDLRGLLGRTAHHHTAGHGTVVGWSTSLEKIEQVPEGAELGVGEMEVTRVYVLFGGPPNKIVGSKTDRAVCSWRLFDCRFGEPPTPKVSVRVLA